MIEIRAAIEGDADQLSVLLEELGFPATKADIAGRLLDLKLRGEVILVCTDGAKLIGFICTHVTPVLHRPLPVGRITSLIVKQSERRRGMGRLLVDSAERYLRQAGCGLIEVTSNQKLADAHQFYERLGYTRTSFRFYKPL